MQPQDDDELQELMVLIYKVDIDEGLQDEQEIHKEISLLEEHKPLVINFEKVDLE